MVKTCCVKNCDIGPKANVACFRFPNNRFLKRKWIDAIGLSNKLTANSTVCIKHFQEDDYDIVRGRPRLKAKVIPSVFCESDKHPISPCITEDDLIANEIDTEITLKSIQKEKLDALNVIDLENEDSTELQVVNELQDDNKLDDDTANGRDEGSKELANEEKTESENVCSKDEEVSTKLQNNDNTTIDDNAKPELDKERTEESQSEAKMESQKEGTVELQSMPSADVQNDSGVELLSEKAQNEGNTKSDEEGSIQNKKENMEKEKISSKKENVEKEKISSKKENVEKEKISSKKENVEKEKKSRKSKPNGVVTEEKRKQTGFQDSFIQSAIKSRRVGEDLHKDIEDIIVNYQIKQTRPLHTVTDTTDTTAVTDTADTADTADTIDLDQGEGDDELHKERDPVFIEVAVEGEAGDRAGSPRDCLMVLESVQVELDPSAFLDGDPDDCHETVDLDDDDDDDQQDHGDGRRPDPISLLTSSDEDEVIIQEPHIDTVEVSDETDEDDLPLVKLLKRNKKKKKLIPIWNPYEYFCMDCQYTASTKQEYKAHTAKHSTIFQVCEICDYTTASKSQFSRHKRKHKDDRKFKCHLCDFKARHNMSLIYHLKSHRALSSAKKGFKCDKCGFKSDVKRLLLRHVKLCTSNIKKYKCDKCVYETKRPSDLRRHKARRHNDDDDDDEDFVPGTVIH